MQQNSSAVYQRDCLKEANVFPYWIHLDKSLFRINFKLFIYSLHLIADELLSLKKKKNGSKCFVVQCSQCQAGN